MLLFAVLVAFCVALVLWTRGGPSTTALPPLGSGGALPTPGSILSAGVTPSSGAQPTPSGSGALSSGGTGLPTAGVTPELPSNVIRTFQPGPHSVVLEASSSSGRLRALAYVFRGHRPTGAIYNVRTPFRVAGHVSGINKLAAIGAQVDSNGGSASCSIIIDGRIVMQRTVSGPGVVAVCGV